MQNLEQNLEWNLEPRTAAVSFCRVIIPPSSGALKRALWGSALTEWHIKYLQTFLHMKRVKWRKKKVPVVGSGWAVGLKRNESVYFRVNRGVEVPVKVQDEVRSRTDSWKWRIVLFLPWLYERRAAPSSSTSAALKLTESKRCGNVSDVTGKVRDNEIRTNPHVTCLYSSLFWGREDLDRRTGINIQERRFFIAFFSVFTH